jgi:hypothetical protein
MMGCGAVGVVSMGRVWPYFVVILSPVLQNLAGLPDADEQRLVEQLVAQLAPLKLSTNPFCCGLPGAM